MRLTRAAAVNCGQHSPPTAILQTGRNPMRGAIAGAHTLSGREYLQIICGFPLHSEWLPVARCGGQSRGMSRDGKGTQKMSSQLSTNVGQCSEIRIVRDVTRHWVEIEFHLNGKRTDKVTVFGPWDTKPERTIPTVIVENEDSNMNRVEQYRIERRVDDNESFRKEVLNTELTVQ